MRFRAAGQRYARKIAWDAVWTWLLGFGLIVYFGLRGGGYDPLVHDQVGIAVWWVLLAAVLVGALPRQPVGKLAWIALGSLAVFVAWTALSMSWTESAEKTSADVARVATYLGVFALALFSRNRGEGRRLLEAIAAGIVFVSIIALISRLHPAWFPEAGQTAKFLTAGRERLSYPLNYWNALACLIAIGLPLVLNAAAGAKSIVARFAAAAAIPALGMTIFLTLSRGSIAAVMVALAVFLVFAADRVPKLVALLIGGAGAAFLIALTIQRPALQHGLDSGVAHHQGNEMLAIAIAVCIVTGAAQAGVSRILLDEKRRPDWTRISRRRSLTVAVAVLLGVCIAAGALDAPGRIANGWSEFKRGGGPGEGAERLGSAVGESRYQFWSAAVREFESKPLTGTGSGTFQYWWTRDGDVGAIVLDTHSLYLQTLGELGIVGLALLLAFLAAVLVGGGCAVVSADGAERAALAAALAGCVAFYLTAVVDWMWQVPVLPVALLLLASILVTARAPRQESPIRLRLLPRAGFAAVALAIVFAIAVPLASTSLVRRSESEFRAGDLAAALSAARRAQSAQPDAASPRLQEALVLEAVRAFGRASEAARAATDREETNWRNWLVLSRVEAERGRADAAVRDFRRARALNPHFPPFQR